MGELYSWWGPTSEYHNAHVNAGVSPVDYLVQQGLRYEVAIRDDLLGIEIYKWADEKTKGRWSRTVGTLARAHFHFEEEQDAILFKLRWG